MVYLIIYIAMSTILPIDLIKNYPDFPEKGINFKDLTPILSNPKSFSDLIDTMANVDFCRNSEALIAIDARGFIFGTAIALKLSKPLILARKPGKLPGDLITDSYDLEYGKNSLSIQKSSIDPFETYTIIDDLLATGGTVACIERLLQKNSKKVLGISVVVELLNLSGRSNLSSQVVSQVKI